MEAGNQKSPPRPFGRQSWFVLGMVALLAALALLVPELADNDDDGVGGARDQLKGEIDGDRYQAVFLSSDRVYFGKLHSLGGQWYELRDAYFIREKAAEGKAGATQQVAPISEELQEPGRHMVVNADHVVQVQNLKGNSRVAQAIEDLDK